jgi:hypothetical protein
MSEKSHNYETAKIHNVRLESSFTTTYNKSAEDRRISFAAKGLLWYLLSRPQDWYVHTWQLADLYVGEKQRGNGIESVRSMLDELKKFGYILYRKFRNSRGHWEHRYDAFPMPFDEFKIMFPDQAKPYLDYTGLVKPSIITSTELPSTELPKEVVCSEPPPVAPVAVKNLERQTVTKHPDGQEIKVTLQDIFSEAVMKKQNWDLLEIEEAWQIMCDYKGPIRSWFAFIGGTIQKLRNNKQHAIITKKTQGKKSCKAQEPSAKSKSEIPKESSTESAIPVQVLPAFASRWSINNNS